jgi:predicted ester cyclase
MRWIPAALLCATLFLACSSSRVGQTPPETRPTADPIAPGNKEVVLRLYEEYFNRRQASILAELVAPEYVNTATGKTGVEGMASSAAFLRQTFGDDMRFTLEDVVAGGDRVVVRWTLRGRHLGDFRGAAPTGRPVELPGIVIYRLSDGRIAESWIQMGAPRPPGGRQSPGRDR